MSEIQLATIKSNIKTIREMLSWASPSSPEVVLEIEPGKVSTVSQSGAGTVTSYSTFNREFFDDLDLGADVALKAIVNLHDMKGFLKHFEQSDTVELRFFGPGPSSIELHETPIAEWCMIDCGVNSWKPLPAAKSNFNDYPPEHCSRFTEQDKFMNRDKTGVYPVEFQTMAEKISRLAAITEYETHDDAVNPIYPLRIKDRKLLFPEWFFENQAEIIIQSHSVPDYSIEQYYTSEFGDIVKSMNGNVRLSTHPDENLLVFVQQCHRNCTIRHVLEPIDLPRDVFNTLVST